MALLGIFGIFGIFGHEDVNFRNNFGVQFSIFSKIVIFAKNAKNGHFWGWVRGPPYSFCRFLAIFDTSATQNDRFFSPFFHFFPLAYRPGAIRPWTFQKWHFLKMPKKTVIFWKCTKWPFWPFLPIFGHFWDPFFSSFFITYHHFPSRAPINVEIRVFTEKRGIKKGSILGHFGSFGGHFGQKWGQLGIFPLFCIFCQFCVHFPLNASCLFCQIFLFCFSFSEIASFLSREFLEKWPRKWHFLPFGPFLVMDPQKWPLLRPPSRGSQTTL